MVDYDDPFGDMILERLNKGHCLLCDVPVSWNSEDTRASDEGSFVDNDGGFECGPSEGSKPRLHQG